MLIREKVVFGFSHFSLKLSYQVYGLKLFLTITQLIASFMLFTTFINIFKYLKGFSYSPKGLFPQQMCLQQLVVHPLVLTLNVTDLSLTAEG